MLCGFPTDRILFIAPRIPKLTSADFPGFFQEELLKKARKGTRRRWAGKGKINYPRLHSSLGYEAFGGKAAHPTLIKPPWERPPSLIGFCTDALLERVACVFALTPCAPVARGAEGESNAFASDRFVVCAGLFQTGCSFGGRLSSVIEILYQMARMPTASMNRW